MIKNFLDFEKNAAFILIGLLAIILISFANTPMLLNIELENIFNSFLISSSTNNIITTNLEPTTTPPLFFWITSVLINLFGFNLELLKLLPTTMMCLIIAISYLFINKQTGSKNMAIILSVILATSPFFITASKLVSLDLVYILFYITTTFIFCSNVYSNNYSNMSTFIAGILLACAFSLTGLKGAAPILANFLLINFVRGGFFINLKFNNPIVLFLGFVSFIIIWISALSKDMSFSYALESVFNYKFIDEFAKFEFDENATLKYITLFIIGGFPWISLLPSALFRLFMTLPKRLNTSSLETSLPLIAALNALVLIIFFACVEREFYILLAIFFNLAMLLTHRINAIEVKTMSFLNIIYFAISTAIIFLFVNEVLNLNLVSITFDSTIKELLINEHTSISNVDNSIMYIIIASYILSALSLFVYCISKRIGLLNLSMALAILNLVLFTFNIFPNLKNSGLNNTTVQTQWIGNVVDKESDDIIFYSIKNPSAAEKANNAYYFDDMAKIRTYLSSTENTTYILFNENDRRKLSSLNRSGYTECKFSMCLLKAK